MAVVDISLRYGVDGQFTCALPEAQVAAWHRPPPADPDLPKSAHQVLESPLDFPPLRQAVVPGDHVVIALDRGTPSAAALIRAAWDVFRSRGVLAEDVRILTPASLNGNTSSDPRGALPDDVREQVRWRAHDPTDRSRCAYLASTTSGERVYLAREVVDADFVLSVGMIAFDSVLGYRGTNSVLYPGLSTVDAIRKAHGQGHEELGPDDVRSLRQTIDEVGWLLGVQFALQILPAARGEASLVLAGNCDAVFRRGTSQLQKQWRVDVGQRPELVVVAIDEDPADHRWVQIGSALETARQLVARDGRIVLLTQVDQPVSEGFDLIRESRTPRDALRPLREAALPDLVPTTQVARALDWANVYLLSRLDHDEVEDLFMIPLNKLSQAQRLLETNESCAFVSSAQHTMGRVVPR